MIGWQAIGRSQWSVTPAGVWAKSMNCKTLSCSPNDTVCSCVGLGLGNMVRVARLSYSLFLLYKAIQSSDCNDVK